MENNLTMLGSSSIMSDSFATEDFNSNALTAYMRTLGAKKAVNEELHCKHCGSVNFYRDVTNHADAFIVKCYKCGHKRKIKKTINILSLKIVSEDLIKKAA